MIWGSIMPHQHLILAFLVNLCYKLCYFEDIINFWIFGLRAIYNFFQVCSFFMINKLNLKQLCEQTINISIRYFVCVVKYIFQRSKFWQFFFINMYFKWHLCLSFSCCIMKDFIDCDVVQAFVVIILGHFAVMNQNLRFCRVWI